MALSLNVDDGEVLLAQKNFHFWHSIDHINHLNKVMSKNKIQNREVSDKLRGLFNPSLPIPPEVTEVKEALTGLSTDELAILEPFVEDYIYYLKNHKLRRSEALEDN